jgi:Protein of unknown function (DUF2892)
MPRNESTTDRSLRLFLGIFLIGLALSGVTALGWIGVIPLVTGLIGWCPAYRLLGINTCKTG